MRRRGEAQAAAHAVADRDRQAAGPLDGREAIDVGEVIAGEYRDPACERWFGKKGLDRVRLVRAAELELEHARTRLQIELVAEVAHQLLEHPVETVRELRRLPVMHGDRSALVLDQHTRVLARDRIEHCAGGRELCPPVRRRRGAAQRIAPLEAVQAGGRPALRRKQPI